MPVTFLTSEDEKKFVKTINGNAPDENGNLEIDTPDSGGNVENGIPAGGNAGQYLCKKSDDDYDVAWSDLVIPEQYGLVTYTQEKTISIT